MFFWNFEKFIFSMKRSIVHHNDSILRKAWQKPLFKPLFKQWCVSCSIVLHWSKYFVSQFCSNNIGTLKFSSPPSVLFFSISTIFSNVGLFTPVILRNCFSLYSFIISYFIILLLYHILFIFSRGLIVNILLSILPSLAFRAFLFLE